MSNMTDALKIGPCQIMTHHKRLQLSKLLVKGKYFFKALLRNICELQERQMLEAIEELRQ